MRVHLSALGCRLNEAELEQWAEAFQRAGDDIVNDPAHADVHVLNTCAVTQEAVRKSRQRLQRLQRENPQAKRVVSGCYSTLAPRAELAELGIDLVVPNTDKAELVSRTREAFESAAMPESATEPGVPVLFHRHRHRAFVKVQDGCRYRCSYCIVTVARGAEQSRPIDAIIGEVNALAATGIQEVVLTGVHVGGYGSDIGSDLETLVRALLAHTDVPRIRFASVEPWDIPDSFIDLFSDRRVQPHMHLPLQSGADSVLRRMARRCRTADFRRLVDTLREAVPGFNVTTDIIVGFPGETDAEWQASLEFIASMRFGHIHVFTYSERAGTRAASLPDSVPMPMRRARSRELHALAASERLAVLEAAVGTHARVLLETGKQTENGYMHSGYTPGYLRVRTRMPENAANRICTLLITGVGDGCLEGRPLTEC